jgi:hypothetical protein
MRVVKDAEQVVRKNTHALQRLELRITRVLKDAIGRSYSTTSSMSLDSICTQADIERMLTDNGSSLSLTLADMTEDTASITIIPDTLSGVECISAKIKFPDAAPDEADYDESVLPGASSTSIASTELLHSTKEPKSGVATNIGKRATVESYYSLPDLLNESSEVSNKNMEQPPEPLTSTPTAQKLMTQIQSSRLPRRTAYKRKLANLIPSLSGYGYSGIEVAVCHDLNGRALIAVILTDLTRDLHWQLCRF